MFERCSYAYRKRKFYKKLKKGLEAGFEFTEMLFAKERFIIYLAKRAVDKENDFEKSDFYFDLAGEIHKYGIEFVGEYYGGRRK
jgi:hypothetical protein